MTVATAFLVGSATLAAVTCTTVFCVTVGAVKSPEFEIDPWDADQVTAVLLLLMTVAVNCCVPADCNVAVAGEIETATVPDGATVTRAVAF